MKKHGTSRKPDQPQPKGKIRQKKASGKGNASMLQWMTRSTTPGEDEKITNIASNKKEQNMEEKENVVKESSAGSSSSNGTEVSSKIIEALDEIRVEFSGAKKKDEENKMDVSKPTGKILSFFKPNGTSKKNEAVTDKRMIEVIDLDDDDDDVVIVEKHKPEKEEEDGLAIEQENKKMKAYASFQEQLQRRKNFDRQFFQGREQKLNPFFAPKTCATKTEELAANEASRGSKQEPKRNWKLDDFPSTQHIVYPSLNYSLDDCSTDLEKKHRFKCPPLRANLAHSSHTGDMPAYDYQSHRCRLSSHPCLHSNLPFWILGLNDTSTITTPEQRLETIATEWNCNFTRVAKLTESFTPRVKTSSFTSLVDQYSPQNATQLCGNDHTSLNLVSWMKEWKAFIQGSTDECSFEEHLYTNDEDTGQEELMKLFVLEGPSGSGKSSMVHAIAQECGFQVLEISSNQARSGKHILQQVGEATQSNSLVTRGRTDSRDDGLDELDSDVELEAGETKKKTRKPRKRKLGRERKQLVSQMKKRKAFNDSLEAHVGEKDKVAMTLIFFDDIDILFHPQDQGLLRALKKLVLRSNCPIITTCAIEPVGFPALDHVHYPVTRPSVHEAGLHLAVICHLENIKLSTGSLRRLVELYECDVRKCLVEIHLWKHQIEALQLTVREAQKSHLNSMEYLVTQVPTPGLFQLDFFFANYLAELEQTWTCPALRSSPELVVTWQSFVLQELLTGVVDISDIESETSRSHAIEEETVEESETCLNEQDDHDEDVVVREKKTTNKVWIDDTEDEDTEDEDMALKNKRTTRVVEFPHYRLACPAAHADTVHTKSDETQAALSRLDAWSDLVDSLSFGNVIETQFVLDSHDDPNGDTTSCEMKLDHLVSDEHLVTRLSRACRNAGVNAYARFHSTPLEEGSMSTMYARAQKCARVGNGQSEKIELSQDIRWTVHESACGQDHGGGRGWTEDTLPYLYRLLHLDANKNVTKRKSKSRRSYAVTNLRIDNDETMSKILRFGFES